MNGQWVERGILTPIAIFKTINIDNTEVSRASLSNITVMENTLNSPCGWKGQKVYVSKRNLIIPKIEEAEEDEVGIEKDYFIIPKICPICGEPTSIHKDNDSEILFCDNPNCEGKIINKITHYVSKKALDIKGLSKATIEKLINWEWIKSIKDIYELRQYKNEWIKKAGFGEKSVNNILNAIEESKNTTFEKFIAGMGIPLVSTTAAKTLAKQYNNSYVAFKEDVVAAFDFSSIDTIGEVISSNILNFNYEEFDEIYKNYLTIEQKNGIINIENENKIKNLIIVITGRLNNGNRDGLKQKIEELGGKVTGSVSSKTSLLINNDIESNSEKNKKAKELGIPIITEKDFYENYLQ